MTVMTAHVPTPTIVTIPMTDAVAAMTAAAPIGTWTPTKK
jgi:hypothetical protein